MSFTGPGYYGQTDAPIPTETPIPGFILFQANLATPASLIHPESTLSRGHRQTLLKFPLGVTSGTWFAGPTLPMMMFEEIMMVSAFRFLRQIGTWEDPRCSSQHGNWGTCTGSASTWTWMQCPQTFIWPWTFTTPNGGIVIFCVVWIV